jgi:hypothetical protein
VEVRTWVVRVGVVRALGARVGACLVPRPATGRAGGRARLGNIASSTPGALGAAVLSGVGAGGAGGAACAGCDLV